MNLSSREARYLYLIYRYSVESGLKYISSGVLAREFKVSQPTVVEVLEKLEDKGLIIYKKRRGAILTENGLNIAREIIWRHRVLESFLVKTLNLDPDYICNSIKGIEHVIDKSIIKRMYEYLSKPRKCPHGDEIPCI